MPSPDHLVYNAKSLENQSRHLWASEGLREQFPPLTSHEALVESQRCLYCYDAPCTQACPTHIDVPRFIKKIVSGNLTGSALAIYEANILGATCARVCPVEQLCEGACVLEAEQRPIMIGRLQRHAMDHAANSGIVPFAPGPMTGRKIAVIGSGPAGLSCAARLRRTGHDVTVFERRAMAGGLSTYGIISLREPTEVALSEVEMLKNLGVRFEFGCELGRNLDLSDLQQRFDAIFLGIGLGRSPDLGIPGEELIVDGLEYIEWSKIDSERLPTGDRVVVIGAGNTAIDCATIARRTGSQRVTMLYRRSEHEMAAYPHEIQLVRNEGVHIEFLVQPVKVFGREGSLLADACTGLPLRHSAVDKQDACAPVGGLCVECLRMKAGSPHRSGKLVPEPIPGSEFLIEADVIVKAIGQLKPSWADQLGIDMESGLIKVDDRYQTSVVGVFAGGDCIRARGAASTVAAVQDGKMAALAIEDELARSGSETCPT